MSEARIQSEIIRWFNNAYCLKHHEPRSLIFSVPNEQKPHLTRTGLKPGASDLIVVHGGQTYFIEVKKPGGRQSPKQKKFEAHAEQAGIPYHIVHSVKEFKEVLGLS